jgi:hypothetical protein
VIKCNNNHINSENKNYLIDDNFSSEFEVVKKRNKIKSNQERNTPTIEKEVKKEEKQIIIDNKQKDFYMKLNEHNKDIIIIRDVEEKDIEIDKLINKKEYYDKLAENYVDTLNNISTVS